MAKLQSNSLFNCLRGTIGKQVVFKEYEGRVILTLYPNIRKRKPTELQAFYRNRMKEANAFATGIMCDWELRKQYEKNLKPGESVFHKAKKEFFEKYRKRTE
jgi:hypothetical protein